MWWPSKYKTGSLRVEDCRCENLGRVPASALRRGSPDPMLCLCQLYGKGITTTTWLEYTLSRPLVPSAVTT